MPFFIVTSVKTSSLIYDLWLHATLFTPLLSIAGISAIERRGVNNN
jgi:hypothetical protein